MATQTSTPGATPARLDIGYTLDHGPFTGMQKFVVFLAAMAIVLDGFDGQLIGFAIPLIIKEWGITKAAFAPAVAAGLDETMTPPGGVSAGGLGPGANDGSVESRRRRYSPAQTTAWTIRRAPSRALDAGGTPRVPPFRSRTTIVPPV